MPPFLNQNTKLRRLISGKKKLNDDQTTWTLLSAIISFLLILIMCYKSTKTSKQNCDQSTRIEENRLCFGAKCRWIENGERPTKYFFNLEKRNYNKKL